MHDIGSDPGLVLLDILAAFPSIDWGWLRWVLDRIGVPRCLIDALFAMYRGSEVEGVLHGHRMGLRLRDTWGIKQGCPVSGSLWALAYDLVTCCLLSLCPQTDLRASVFADDIGLATLRIVDFLRATFPYVTLVCLAAGIALRCGKTAVLRGGPSGAAELRAAHRRARAAQVLDSAKMQCMILGPGSAPRPLALATHKFTSRARHVKSLTRAWTDRS